MNKKALFTSNSDEWETPLELYTRLNKRFKFTLDPCSTKENHLCDKYYTKEENGLCKSWKARFDVKMPCLQNKTELRSQWKNYMDNKRLADHLEVSV